MDTQRTIFKCPDGKVKPNTRWASDRLKFIVDRVTEDDIGIWVFYRNEITNQNYNCLMDAFIQRFSQDHSYEQYKQY
jgi:hypothetical protein